MSRNSRKANILLWSAQIVLALLFVFAGGSKLVMSVEAMQQGPVQLPGAFLRFIGVAELLGGLGLVLPGIFKVHRHLTPLAAAGLVIIMIGATVLTASTGIGAMFPAFVGVLAATVCKYRGGIGIQFRTSRRAQQLRSA
jgi:uncharacterized membrane protein YphA (DoxX/SURF4 family)